MAHPSMPPGKKPRVLVVDDEQGIRDMLSILFQRDDYDVTLAPGFAASVDAIKSAPTPFELVLTDLLMPDGSGLDVLSAAKARTEHTEVIVMTAYAAVETAIDAMKRGAYDFVTKPFSTSELRALALKALEKRALVTENQRLRAQVDRARPKGILGRSEPMRRVLDLVARVARSKSTVLVTGESGTGKERVARAVHDLSDRAEKPFLVVNCGALPEALIESELFGHDKGAFTGAMQKHLGLFQDADGGTVLLDEVGELPPQVQVKLLRVLQERKVRSVGSTAEVDVDVRVIAATNRNVEEDVKSGKFRQDLYYRLNVLRIELPPLRERHEDIRELAEHFLRRCAAENGKEISRAMPSRATCASSRTWSSAPSRWRRARSSVSEISHASWWARRRRRRPSCFGSLKRGASSTRSSARWSDGSSCRPSNGRAAYARQRRSYSG